MGLDDMFFEKHPKQMRRMELLASSNEAIRDNDEKQERTEALTTARVLSLAFLPRKRTLLKQVSRILRFGRDSFVQVVYTTGGKELPFGADRFVLSGIIHLALASGSPKVTFESANALLKMFKFSSDGRQYDRLRERLFRISNLFITIRYGKTEKELLEGMRGEHSRVVASYDLPLRKELQSEDTNSPDRSHCVTLSPELWEHLKNRLNHLTIPLDLLYPFTDKPAAWDLCTLLFTRCISARSESVIDHDVLMGMFRDGNEPDRKVIDRLKSYLFEINTATDNRLNALFVEYRPTNSSPYKKYWRLLIKPMTQPVLWSGKKAQ